ncbi:MAG: ADP-glyceromanno-heptose 6-epimerase [Alphaproteobacteria bacterium]
MIVVTGGAGFIGSNLLAGLEEHGAKELVVCDTLGQGDKWRNIAKRELADIVAPASLIDFLKARRGRIQAIFHLGAVSSTTETDADLILHANFATSLEIWNHCAANGVPLIYASSAATYGDGSLGFDDDATVAGLKTLRPLNAYGWSKHLFDRRVARLIAEREPAPPQWAGLKFFNVYGPNEYHKGEMRSVIAKNFEAARKGEPIQLFKSYRQGYADGGQKRDFVWVGDCVAVMLWLLVTPGASGLFNLGSGEAHSFADLAAALYRALGAEPRIEYIEMPESLRPRYQYFTEARMDRLREAGYAAPFTALEDGVRDYVTSYLLNEDPYR